MRRLVVPASLLLVISLASTQPAEACGGEEGDVILMVMGGAAVVGAIDLGLSIHDVAVDDSSTTYAAIEVLLTAPQVTFGLWALREELGDDFADGDAVVVAGLYTAWTGVLLAHGIYELIEGTRPAPRSDKRFVIAPAQVSDGAQVGTGLGLSGTF